MNHHPRRLGFSLVELVVVVGISALLLGLLLPALSTARTRARKTRETSDLRLVGMAWTMYANQSNDAVLPGHLSSSVQRGWHVSYRYGDGSLIPPAPDYPANQYAGGPPNVAGPWPWRLMPYLDYNAELMLGYRFDLSAEALDPQERTVALAGTPAFAYNGLFFGGFWTDTRRPWYDPARTHVEQSDGTPIRVVSRSVGSVRRSAEVIIYTTAAERLAGLHRFNPAVDDRDGTHLVVPPIVGREPIWGLPNLRAESASPAAPSGDRHAVTARLTGVVDVLHIYGNDSWDGNPFEFG